MPVEIIDPLRPDLRALRTIQAPDHVQPAGDRPHGYRISSAAFKAGTDGSVSVDLEESLLLASLDLRARYPALARAVALVAHRVETFTGQGMTVGHVPIPGNDHHGEVRMAGLSSGAIRRAARALAGSCEMVEPLNVTELQRHVAAQKSI